MEILLKVNDVIGIGCDTSKDEIGNESCYVFQLKQQQQCEIISLSDSEEEEEFRIQEQYSQLNCSEMKQELMELEDFVDEYTRVKVEHDVECVQDDGVEFVSIIDDEIQQRNVGMQDVFENIISNSDKSYAEKTELIKRLEPDVASLLAKDFPKNDTTEATLLIINKENSKGMSHGEQNGFLLDSKLNSAKTIKERKDSEIEMDATSPMENLLAIVNRRRLTISIPQLKISSDSLNFVKLEHASIQHMLTEKSSNIPTQTVEATNNRSNELVNAKIMNRRHSCFVPSSNFPPKRKLEIIEAPHMMKRRKSISVMPESLKRPTKKVEFDKKWMCKSPKIEQKKRTKEQNDELKSKLAALTADSKEKVVEVKPIRPITKIPVKVTQKTRNDYLTDTFVKSMSMPTPSKQLASKESAHKITKCVVKKDGGADEILLNDSAHSPEISKRVQIAHKEVTEPKPRCDLNGNSTKLATIAHTATATTAVVKSILKKPNQIQRRRTTVTFADDFRINNFKTPDAATNDERNSDDVIYNIMSLGVSSLKQSSSSPPINGKRFNYQTVAYQYESLKHLQK